MLMQNLRQIMLQMIIVILFVHSNVLAKDLGNYGQVFEVKEQGILEMLRQKTQSLDMAEIHKEMQEKVRKKVMNPDSVLGMMPASKGRIFYHDPSFILDEDMVLPCGTVIYRKGTLVNPLKSMDLERELIFVDAREKEQIAWLKEKLGNQSQNQNQIRIILVGGSVFELEKDLACFSDEIKEQVYFDQDGVLVGKFGIKHSPAVLVQEEDKLRIAEINIKEAEMTRKKL